MPSSITCPACNYTRQPTDDSPDWECPKCHKEYLKTARTLLQHVNTKGVNLSTGELPQQLGITSADLSSYDKFIQKLEVIDNSLKQIMALKIHDPVVMITQWSPIELYGASFCTHELKEITVGRLEFRAAAFSKALYIFLILLGVGEAIYISVSHLGKGIFFTSKTAGILILCLLFVAIGGYLLIKKSAPIVFDVRRGLFWKGKKNPNEVVDRSFLKDFTKLENVHALQIIPVLNPRSGNFLSYYSYELNLVLTDGKRISVVNHGDRNKLVSDADRLGRFLGKPVWDAIDSSIDFYKSFQS